MLSGSIASPIAFAGRIARAGPSNEAKSVSGRIDFLNAEVRQSVSQDPVVGIEQ
jgi:hypothetical protein